MTLRFVTIWAALFIVQNALFGIIWGMTDVDDLLLFGAWVLCSFLGFVIASKRSES